MDKSNESSQAEIQTRLKRRDLLKAAYAAPILAPLLLSAQHASAATGCTPNSCAPVGTPAPCNPAVPCSPSSCSPTSCAPYPAP